MKVALRLFVSSAAFGCVLALVYWFLTYEPAGTLLLGFMAAALTVVAVYMVFAELNANLLADKPDATHSEAVGENVGTFITHSPIPFCVGLGVFMAALGLIVAPAAAALGLLVLLVLIAALMVRSK